MTNSLRVRYCSLFSVALVAAQLCFCSTRCQSQYTRSGQTYFVEVFSGLSIETLSDSVPSQTSGESSVSTSYFIHGGATLDAELVRFGLTSTIRFRPAIQFSFPVPGITKSDVGHIPFLGFPMLLTYNIGAGAVPRQPSSMGAAVGIGATAEIGMAMGNSNYGSDSFSAIVYPIAMIEFAFDASGIWKLRLQMAPFSSTLIDRDGELVVAKNRFQISVGQIGILRSL